jgi:hypothetical protein
MAYDCAEAKASAKIFMANVLYRPKLTITPMLSAKRWLETAIAI